MGRQIHLSDGEWRLVHILWNRSPQTVTELVHAVAGDTGWTKHTIMKMLSRLEEKGALRSENVGKVLGYYPLIEREDAAMSETADLIDRVYRGSLSQLVSTFTKRQSLSKEEIDELYAMLRRMEDGHA